MSNHFKRSGFTLIELSVSLVIIGLLAGGILVGQDLIHAAAIRSQMKQVEQYQTAFNTFRTKYNCIPGDCPNITEFLGTADPSGNPIINGDDNGVIDTSTHSCYDNGTPCNSPNWSTSPELWGALQQLGVAGFVDFIPSAYSEGYIGKSIPASKINAAGGFFLGASYNFTAGTGSGRNPDTSQYQTGTNLLWFVVCNNPTYDQMGKWDNNCGVFEANELQAIDTKIDDGLPLSGHVFGFGGGSPSPPIPDCLTPVGNTYAYKISNNTQQCQAAFVLD